LIAIVILKILHLDTKNKKQSIASKPAASYREYTLRGVSITRAEANVTVRSTKQTADTHSKSRISFIRDFWFLHNISIFQKSL
jgi:hypothetical protein